MSLEKGGHSVKIIEEGMNFIEDLEGFQFHMYRKRYRDSYNKKLDFCNRYENQFIVT